MRDFSTIEIAFPQGSFFELDVVSFVNSNDVPHKFSIFLDLPPGIVEFTIHSTQDVLQGGKFLLEQISHIQASSTLKRLQFKFERRFKSRLHEYRQALSYEYWRHGITLSFEFHIWETWKLERADFHHDEGKEYSSSDIREFLDDIEKKQKPSLRNGHGKRRQEEAVFTYVV